MGMSAMKFQKILIANRCEIAVRVMNTCRLMGIATVAVFAEDDAQSLHRQMADEAYSLGEGGPAETYLNSEKIVEIAKRSGADAIHPGYGFLSERASFCGLCQKNGLVFIGPSPQTIALMGDKRESKKAMEKIGVPLIPGDYGQDQEASSLLAKAKEIGPPLLIKALAGGGGKGMRLVEDLSDFSLHLEQAKREAQNAFGDDQVLLEKFISHPRHIEVQVLSDGHNQHFHFWERECSLQRRHQKIVEETPSPALDQSLREKICKTAVRICQKINYRGAGTVEFILDEGGGKERAFYFLEMNTRLQVEHPITEMVTGYDLVELQIRVAQGEKLELVQEKITQNGHALEVRIYAEDPDQNFLPTTGTLRLIGQTRLSSTRLECGYVEGDVLGIQYDPMIAKLCSHSHNRSSNIRKMGYLLEDYPFLGLSTNTVYLKRILDHPEFKKGKTLTHFVQTYAKDLAPKKLTRKDLAKVAGALTLFPGSPTGTEHQVPSSCPSLFVELGHFRNS